MQKAAAHARISNPAPFRRTANVPVPEASACRDGWVRLSVPEPVQVRRTLADGVPSSPIRKLFCFVIRWSETQDPQLRRLLLYPTELRNRPSVSDATLLRCAKKQYTPTFQTHPAENRGGGCGNGRADRDGAKRRLPQCRSGRLPERPQRASTAARSRSSAFMSRMRGSPTFSRMCPSPPGPNICRR